jgi:hypothetical protein
MKTRINFVILVFAILVAAGICSSCSTAPDAPLALKAEKPFASAGSVEMQLDAGNYTIRPAGGDQIRVSFGGNTGTATADLTTSGTHASLVVKDAPHSNFKATIEVPKTSDVVIHLAAGNLEMAAISGSKDLDSKAGNVEIAVGSASDYSSVDATVKVGNLDGGPFGDSGAGGLSHHLTWSGKGKYTLRASLGAGNLELK